MSRPSTAPKRTLDRAASTSWPSGPEPKYRSEDLAMGEDGDGEVGFWAWDFGTPEMFPFS